MTTTARTRDAIVDALIGKDDRQRFTFLNDAEYHAQVELLAEHLPDDAASPEARRTLEGIGIALAAAAEKRYLELGLPWHRGYLFHGPPGTGKTSFARALANHFGLDIYFIALSSVREDENLLRQVGSVPAGSLLLLEDIDVVHGTKVRDDEHRGVSLSAFLNALDGVVTPHGLITVMTSNDISELDEALLRPGRVDQQFTFDFLTPEGLDALGAILVGEPVSLPFRSKLTAAELIEAVKPVLDHDPSEIEASLRKCLTAV